MTCVSLGPKVEGEHTPEERIVISTVPKFWSILTQSLKILTEDHALH